MRLTAFCDSLRLLSLLSAVLIALPVRGADSPKPKKKGATQSTPKPVDDSAQTVAAKARDSVVVISHFGREGKTDGVGTGFVVSSDGLIATSLHVIGEGRPVVVEGTGGRKLEVIEVVGWDRRNDLALLRVRATGLAALPLGDSDALKAGEDVVAIGNPMGLEHSVVRGVVSARREIEGVDMIQVAIPIEPGNSGGPLIDFNGRVQGIIALKSLMTANLGFAVPVNALKRLMTQPTPMPMDRWMNIGLLDPAEWEGLMGAHWRQKVDRIMVEGVGEGFGGRSLCLSKQPPLKPPFEMAVTVKLDDEAGAAGLVFGSDGGDRHYGFYPTSGQLRLTRFDGANVFTWTILEQASSEHYRKGEWNRIKVRVEAERIACFVNGHQVFESKAPEFVGERIGLCKFRNTQAEFRGFSLGVSVDPADASPSEPLVSKVRDFLAAPSSIGESKLAQALLETPDAGRRYLSERAGQLEHDAGELRRIARVAHSHRIEKELQELLTAGEKEIDLVQAALLVARFDDPDLEPEPYRRQVDRMAREISSQIPANAEDPARISALKRYFFQEQGFHASRQDYYDKANSYLNSVIEHREGIPITLSVLFLELGQRVGVSSLRAHPLPGHFMLAYKRSDGTERVIDVFEGARELTHAEADLVVGHYSEGEARSELMEPARKRDVIIRMLRNLQGVARGEDTTVNSLRYLGLILALQPNSAIDRLDRARLRAKSGDSPGAKEDVQWLLDHSPPGFDAERLEEILRSL